MPRRPEYIVSGIARDWFYALVTMGATDVFIGGSS
jgi:hypothetical protein